MPVSSPRRTARRVPRPLVVVAGEIVGLVTSRRDAATPLLLDVAVRAMRDGTAALVLDVPFERMGHEARVVAGRIARSAAQGGAAVVVVAHRRATLAHLVDRMIVLDAGTAGCVASTRCGTPMH